MIKLLKRFVFLTKPHPQEMPPNYPIVTLSCCGPFQFFFPDLYGFSDKLELCPHIVSKSFFYFSIREFFISVQYAIISAMSIYILLSSGFRLPVAFINKLCDCYTIHLAN